MDGLHIYGHLWQDGYDKMESSRSSDRSDSATDRPIEQQKLRSERFSSRSTDRATEAPIGAIQQQIDRSSSRSSDRSNSVADRPIDRQIEKHWRPSLRAARAARMNRDSSELSFFFTVGLSGFAVSGEHHRPSSSFGSCIGV